jgi:hypothetical protein
MGPLEWLRARWRREQEAAKADPRDLLLAALPVIVGVVGASLLFPRAVLPSRVPLPTPEEAVLRGEAGAEEALAERAGRDGLPPGVRELGGALRDWNLLAFRSDDAVEHDAHAHAMRLGALARSVREEHGDDALLALRALQTRTFLAELARFEATGDESDELRAVGGNVVARMQAVGWIDGHRLALAERTWRVLYKSLWARALGLSDIAPFALSLDDEREIARVQIAHPHPAEVDRALLDSERRRAEGDESCELLARRTREAEDRWRLGKIEAWGARDPSYPLDYARGVVLFRLGRFPESARAFATVRERGGPYAERAFFHERAALVATAVE